MTQQVANDKDVFELTRGELNSVIAYLGKRPAEETFGLLSLLLGRGPSKVVAAEPAQEASAEVAVAEIAEEAKSTEQ